MYCTNCGQEVSEKAVVCIHCGCAVVPNRQTRENKSKLGFVCGFFLGILGLMVGLTTFHDQDYEKKTFFKGWIKGIIIAIIVGVVIALAIVAVVYRFYESFINSWYS